MIFKNNINMMTKEEMLMVEINEFKASNKLKLMQEGENYYGSQNSTILKRETKRNASDAEKPNNKLVHSFFKNQVDEKVGYLLSNEATISSEDENYSETVRELLGEYFNYDLIKLGENASISGISWLYVYINEKGEFKYKVIPSRQCVPIWVDSDHTKLEAMLRVYEIVVYEGKEKKTVTKVEYCTDVETIFYVIYKGKLILDIEKNEGKPLPHYYLNNSSKGWGKVPYIPFKNNNREMTDLIPIKTLIDGYDMSRSDVSNYLDEVQNLIYILTGYGGQDKNQFISDLNYYRAIMLEDSEGGVSTLNPTVDINAAREHFEQLKRDINEFGQSYSKDLDKIGNAPSGEALKMLFQSLDLKCNKMEAEFKKGFEKLLYFINQYKNTSGTAKITFNRNILINKTAKINQCASSKGLVSDRTILANHPWVTDIEYELEELQKQKEELQKQFGNYKDE